MASFRHFVDMRQSPEEKMEAMMPAQMDDSMNYPSGLCICLTEQEMEKLDLDDDVEDGDMLHLQAMAKVTSVTKRNGGCRVEMQIVMMGVEDESTEELPDDDD